MDAIPIQPQPAREDLQLFHTLSVLAAAGHPIAELLQLLGQHLGVSSIDILPASAAPPPGTRLVMAPLSHNALYLTLPPDLDAAATAARLSVFIPVFTLATTRSQNVDVSEERDRFEAVLEATNDAIVLLTPAGIVGLVTSQFETFTGIPRHQITGHPVSKLIHLIAAQPNLNTQMVNLFQALTDNWIESLGGEFEITSDFQHRVLVWYSLPVYSQGGSLVGRVFAFRDATHERDVDRMQTEFVALVSHELRTPLTSVKGFSDLILESHFSTLHPDVREYIEIIAINANRIIDLINDILDITRIDSDRVDLKPCRCSLPAIIEQVTNHLEYRFKRHRHTLLLDLQAELPLVWVDQTRLAQVITNLLTNAIKYTLEPGHITVRARFIQTSEQLPPEAPRNQIVPCVMVMVEDSGIGISPEDQQNLFKRFYRTEKSRLIGGIGLGLAIVKAFVEMHGGCVWVKSTVGQGSCFSFSVPLAPQESYRLLPEPEL
ncbi:MAG TPA: PAS domain-containing sensor histidine kinase [Aggregatilineaceae bacterium]|nr:PAS domain-containing sensor histidine kinase [Aggregatilineaceae bacterium]